MEMNFWTLHGRNSELQLIAERIPGAEPRSVVRVTRWAVGTSAAAAIPLGAVAHSLPALGTSSGPLTLLQRSGVAIADQAESHWLVLSIDDAHLLDELSVTLMHQLVLTRVACLLLTVRTGKPDPDPVVTLCKSGVAGRLELRQLHRAKMDRLVTGVLDGVVDGRTIEGLWRATRGNVLFLREMVEEGRETSRLRMREGVRYWEGLMEPRPRLHEVVQAQLGGLGADERTALKLLVTGEPAQGTSTTTTQHVHRDAAQAAAIPPRAGSEVATIYPVRPARRSRSGDRDRGATMPMTTATRSHISARATAGVADLLPHASGGEAVAWDEVLRRYGKLVSATVRSFRLQDADTLDAVQMTWLRLAENAHQVVRSERLGGWLTTTARRECLRILRQAKPTPDSIETVADTVADPSVSPEQRAIEVDAAQTLWNLVEELSPRHRILLRALFTDHPRPYAEVARTAGIPAGAIGPTRARALQQLRDSLEDHGLGLAAWR